MTLREAFEMHIMFVRGGITNGFDHFIRDANNDYIMSDIQSQWLKWKHRFANNASKGE